MENQITVFSKDGLIRGLYTAINLESGDIFSIERSGKATFGGNCVLDRKYPSINAFLRDARECNYWLGEEMGSLEALPSKVRAKVKEIIQ